MGADELDCVEPLESVGSLVAESLAPLLGAKGEEMEPYDVHAIARVCHEANRAYCITIGDTSQAAWDEAPGWQKESCVDGIRKIAKNPAMTAEDSHANWLDKKTADGWKYGPVKDVEKKEHPSFKPYAELDEAEKRKDHLFRAIVLALI